MQVFLVHYYYKYTFNFHYREWKKIFSPFNKWHYSKLNSGICNWELHELLCWLNCFNCENGPFVCQVLESVLALKCVIRVPCIWSTETKGLIYFINPIALCCNLDRCQGLSFGTQRGSLSPLPVLHLLLTDSALVCAVAPACLLHAAVWCNPAGWVLWLGGCISSHYARSSSLHLTVG